MGTLTDKGIKSIKPGLKPQKLFDGGGLYLYVTTKGQKYWRYNYRYQKKQKTLSLGVYPAVTLKEARLKHQDAKKNLAEGEDPGFKKKIDKAMKTELADNSFEAVAWLWFGKQKKWSANYRIKQKTRLTKDILPYLGDRSIDRITAKEILIVCRRVEARGAIETAHRIKRICSQVFQYALGLDLVDSDPGRDLRNVLTPIETKHMAALTVPKEVGGLMRAIHGFTGTAVVRAALIFSAYTFPRPTEIRHAEWSEIDLNEKLWRLPPEKMKERRRHLVPLSRQAIETLQEIHPLTGDGQYIFPGMRGKGSVISENTVNAALRRLGFSQTEHTHHGFRATASTLLHEQGWDSEVVEMQLSHVDGNDSRRSYNHAKYLSQRTKMMQGWADYLDGLKVGGEIINFKKKA